ncbi:AAA family ATPase, partial [Hydrogenophilus thiooxidans]|uniref:ATP-binding protein n=1 Tax=Hydrogenophilus thiooxidans TaxID=2820326 RepID=UPI001C215CE7
MRKKLPIGIQSFTQIRREGYYYVDKTPFLARMVASGGKYYFLSRPRRFGKSLLLDTIACAFSGQRELFAAHDGHDGSAPREALYLADHWDWNQRYPVIRFSFGTGTFPNEAAIDAVIRYQLKRNAHQLGLGDAPQWPQPGLALLELIERATNHHDAPAVVLVDEYDKPILDVIVHPEQAAAHRAILRDLYSVLKEAAEHLRFVFLTGVSKFSQVSLFSGLNNLNDITLDDDFAAICGYTEADLDTVFAPEFAAAAAEGRPLDRERLRFWYNGYWWGGADRVYNPFDVLLCLAKREYRP